MKRTGNGYRLGPLGHIEVVLSVFVALGWDGVNVDKAGNFPGQNSILTILIDGMGIEDHRILGQSILFGQGAGAEQQLTLVIFDHYLDPDLTNFGKTGG